MNKRIRELAEQAGFVLWADEEWNPGETIDWASNYDNAIVKYTELIAQECLDKISGLIIPETFEQDIGPYEKWNQALGHAALEIEQHFFGDSHDKEEE